MSTGAVAIIGFVALFGLMLLRVPVGMAMGLVGVTGFGYIVGGVPALKMVGQTSMRTVANYNFGIIPMFLLMGAIVSASGISRELFRAANTFVGHLRGGLGIATIGACAAFAAISGSSVATAATFATVAYPEMRRLSLSPVVLDRRHRGRRHARRDVPALDGAGGLRPHHRAGHRQAVHRRHPARHPRGVDVHRDDRHHRLRPPELPAGRRAQHVRRAAAGAARGMGAAAALRLRHRRALWRPLHADRGRRHGRGRRLPDQRRAPPAAAQADAAVAAACDAHRRGGVHRADRRAAVRLFPHRHPDAAARHRVPHQPRPRPLRRAGADHADVSRARLPDGRARHDHPDGADHLPGGVGAGLRSHLVRHHHRHDGRARPHPPAGRHERLRHQDGGAGGELPHHLHRRAALHRRPTSCG